jgi:hypothetical protein
MGANCLPRGSSGGKDGWDRAGGNDAKQGRFTEQVSDNDRHKLEQAGIEAIASCG